MSGIDVAIGAARCQALPNLTGRCCLEAALATLEQQEEGSECSL
jgi:hypothetical protein